MKRILSAILLSSVVAVPLAAGVVEVKMKLPVRPKLNISGD